MHAFRRRQRLIFIGRNLPPNEKLSLLCVLCVSVVTRFFLLLHALCSIEDRAAGQVPLSVITHVREFSAACVDGVITPRMEGAPTRFISGIWYGSRNAMKLFSPF